MLLCRVWEHPVFMYQFTTEPQKMPRQQDATQKCQMTLTLCLKIGGNYARNKPTGSSDQPQMTLFRFTKQQLISESDTNLPQANPDASFISIYH